MFKLLICYSVKMNRTRQWDRSLLESVRDKETLWGSWVGYEQVGAALKVFLFVSEARRYWSEQVDLSQQMSEAPSSSLTLGFSPFRITQEVILMCHMAMLSAHFTTKPSGRNYGCSLGRKMVKGRQFVAQFASSSPRKENVFSCWFMHSAWIPLYPAALMALQSSSVSAMWWKVLGKEKCWVAWFHWCGVCFQNLLEYKIIM